MRACLSWIAAVCVALLAWEAILQAVYFRLPPDRPHRVLGTVTAPGTYVSMQEGFCRARIAADGLRGADTPPSRSGEYRLLFVGDSFTEALQVPDRETFAERAGVLVRSKGMPVYVANAGHSGALAATLLGQAPAYASMVAPDITIVQFRSGSFGPEAYSAGKKGYYINRTPRGPEVRYDAPPRLGSVDNALLNWLRTRSVVRLARLQVKRITQRRQAGPAVTASEAPDPVDPAVIRWAIKELKRSYDRMVVLYIPTDCRSRAVASAPDEVALRSACGEIGVPFVSMRSAFAACLDRRHAFPNGFDNTAPGEGHLNQVGHDLVAHELASAIARTL